jgi:hypothetical protein
MSAGGYGAAANVVGGIMQAIAANQEQKAMFSEFQKELTRQGSYRAQAYTGWEDFLPQLGADQARDTMAKAAATREGSYADLANLPGTQYGGGPTESRDRAYFDITGRNRAKLSAYSDWINSRNIGQQREQQGLTKIANFAQGTASVFPYREYQAQHSWDELAFWGQLISSIGGTATNYGQLFGGAPSPYPPGGGTPSTAMNFTGQYPDSSAFNDPQTMAMIAATIGG